MTLTLFDAALAVARATGTLRTGTADSGGSTTTFVDSHRNEADDVWNGGACFHITDSEFSEITDFVNSTGTITVLDDFTAATTDGDRYAITKPKHRLDWMIEAVNQVLTATKYLKTDTSSVSIADDQSEYDLPAGCDRNTIRAVYVELDDDSDDHLWQELRNWSIEKTATGTVDKLMIPYHVYDAGDAVKLEYVAYHSALYDDADDIDESITMDYIVPQAIVNLLYNELETDNASGNIEAKFNLWQEKADYAKNFLRPRIPLPSGNVMIAQRSRQVKVQEVDYA